MVVLSRVKILLFYLTIGRTERWITIACTQLEQHFWSIDINQFLDDLELKRAWNQLVAN